MSSYSWLLEATITSTIVAVIIVSIRLILKEKLSGKLKYYLWVIFLIRLMVIPLPESKISIYNLIPQKSSVQQEATLNNTENNSESTSNNLITDNSSNNMNSNQNNNVMNNSTTIEKQTLSMSIIAFSIYKAGVVTFLFIALLSYLLFIYRFRATDIVIEEAVLQRLEEIKKRLNIKRKIKVIYGDTPFIYGIFKVKLAIPEGLEVQELDSVILHELNHYKYGDLYINWLLIFLKAIYWFNPIVWIVFKQIRKDCEVACDERVLESNFIDKKSYATVLFKNALKGNRYLVGTSSFSKEGSDIKGRIKLIQSFRKKKNIWITLGLIIFVIVATITLTNGVSSTNDFIVLDNDKKIIREYLHENVESWLNENQQTYGEIYSAFKILGTGDNEIYIWLLKEGKITGGTSLPIVLKVQRFNGNLEVLSYERPRDGAGLAKDVKKLFPKDIQDEIFAKDPNKYNKMIAELQKEIEEIKFNKWSNNNEEAIEIKNSTIDLNASIGADGPYLDFASDDIVIFHGYFGLFVYDLKENKIRNSLDLKYINCDVTQGDDYCEVTVHDGREVRLHNISTDDMYVFDVYENTLTKKPYEKGYGIAQLFVTPEEITKKEFFTSYMSQKFKNGEIGYLALTDGTFRSFEYVRGDKRVKLFE